MEEPSMGTTKNSVGQTIWDTFWKIVVGTAALAMLAFWVMMFFSAV